MLKKWQAMQKIGNLNMLQAKSLDPSSTHPYGGVQTWGIQKMKALQRKMPQNATYERMIWGYPHVRTHPCNSVYDNNVTLKKHSQNISTHSQLYSIYTRRKKSWRSIGLKRIFHTVRQPSNFYMCLPSTLWLLNPAMENHPFFDR